MEKSGRVTGIQKFSIHDGPGIRTVVFLKGCPLRCPWCSNPETQESGRETMYAVARCIGCGQCAEACPEKCIAMDGGRLVIYRKNCRLCGACEKACPTGAVMLRGEEKTAEEVLEEARKDMVFYRKSGGGVTFSGGEPLMQFEFVEELAAMCKKEGIHTAIETSGYVKWKDMERILPRMDLVLYDLKIFDTERHEEIIGVSAELIQENLEKLCGRRKRIHIRVPVVPGYTADEENLRSIGIFVRDLGLKDLQLLPYHNYGAGKYPQLDKSYALAGQPSLKREELLAVKEMLTGLGLSVRIGG